MKLIEEIMRSFYLRTFYYSIKYLMKISFRKFEINGATNAQIVRILRYPLHILCNPIKDLRELYLFAPSSPQN